MPLADSSRKLYISWIYSDRLCMHDWLRTSELSQDNSEWDRKDIIVNFEIVPE